MLPPKDHNGGPAVQDEGHYDDDGGATNWFAVSRDIFDHPIVGIHDRPYTDTEAWLSLIAMAAYVPRRLNNKGSVVIIDPGQLMAAHKFLEVRWRWTFAKVRHFLKRLETEAMITRYRNEQPQNRNNQIQIISICNYSTYQKLPSQPQQAHDNRATTEQQPSSKPATSEQQANNNNLTLKELNTPPSESEPRTEGMSETKISDDVQRKRIVYSPDFERFWGGYPDRTNNSKINAWQAWQKLSPDDRHQAIASLPAFTAFCRSKPDYPVIHVERYLKHRRFESQGQMGTVQASGQWWHDASKVAAISPDRWRKAIVQHANGIWPIEKLGPPPGDARCVVPDPVLTEMRLAEIYDETGKRRDGTHGMLA